MTNEILGVIEIYEKKYENLPMCKKSLHLKKKNGGDRCSKRTRPWNEKLATSKKDKRQHVSITQEELRYNITIIDTFKF